MRGRLFGMRAQTAAAWIGLILAANALGAPVTEDIRDIRGPMYLLPDWVLPVLIAGTVLVALSTYGLWRWRRKRAARVWLPHELALQRLEDIRTLMQPASAREFSTAVSDVVRSYIEQSFDVTATRRTTEEFLRDLLESSNASLAKHQGLLGEFLQQCDFVKFAALALTLQNMESLRQSARAFVLATAPTAEKPAAEKTHDSIPAT
jgi:hypothetical protein